MSAVPPAAPDKEPQRQVDAAVDRAVRRFFDALAKDGWVLASTRAALPRDDSLAMALADVDRLERGLADALRWLGTIHSTLDPDGVAGDPGDWSVTARLVRDTAAELASLRQSESRVRANRDAVAATLDRLYGEVERIADDCSVRAIQRAGTTNASSRVALDIYDKIATQLRTALDAPPTHDEETPA